MGVYLIWKFAKNKEAAQKYVVDQQLDYQDHFVRSKFYNFPPWTNAIKGGFKTIRQLAAQDAHKPRGKYTVLTTIAEKYTTNPGHPGNTTPVMDEIYNTFLIPQMFATVAQGKADPGRGGIRLRSQGGLDLPQVAQPEARVGRRAVRAAAAARTAQRTGSRQRPAGAPTPR